MSNFFQDLERIVNDSKHGVIYMSMGSTLRGDSFPEDKKQAILKAFSRIPQRIVWKWEGEMKNKPENVLTYRWVPQRDILCKLTRLEKIHCIITTIRNITIKMRKICILSLITSSNSFSI